MGIDVKLLFEKIQDVIIKSLLSVEPHIFNALARSSKHKNICFELYGFDVLIDDNLNPWIMEVNVSPSLSSSSPLDKKIKTMLLSDVFNLIGLKLFVRKKLEKEEEAKKIERILGIKSIFLSRIT